MQLSLKQNRRLTNQTTKAKYFAFLQEAVFVIETNRVIAQTALYLEYTCTTVTA